MPNYALRLTLFPEDPGRIGFAGLVIDTPAKVFPNPIGSCSSHQPHSAEEYLELSVVGERGKTESVKLPIEEVVHNIEEGYSTIESHARLKIGETGGDNYENAIRIYRAQLLRYMETVRQTWAGRRTSWNERGLSAKLVKPNGSVIKECVTPHHVEDGRFPLTD